MSISNKAGDNEGEASMDEILASIRKIIADDPSAPRGGPDLRPDSRSFNPLFENTAPNLRGPDISDGGRPLLPPAPRFDDALRAGPDPRQVSPPLRGRPFADQALAELLDDGPAQYQPPAQPPAANAFSATAKFDPPAAGGDGEPALPTRPPATVTVTAATAAAGAPDPWAAWRNLRAAASPGSPPPAPVSPIASPSLMAPAAPSHAVMPPFVTQHLAAPSGVSSGVAPLELAADIHASQNALAVNSSPTQSQFNSSVGDNKPLTVAEPNARSPLSPDAKAVAAPVAADSPPLTDREKLPPVKTTMPAVKPGFYPPTSATTIRRQPASFMSAFPRSTDAAPPAPMENGVQSAAVEPPKVPAVELAPVRSSLDAAIPAAAADLPPPPLAADVILAGPIATPGSHRLNGNAPVPVADPTAVAASIALEKLAAGLSEAPVAPAPVSAQVDLGALASVAYAATGPMPAPRTLDDMVSDLLRPMLEKWVESNMPRLMEKALRPGTAKEPGPPKP